MKQFGLAGPLPPAAELRAGCLCPDFTSPELLCHCGIRRHAQEPSTS